MNENDLEEPLIFTHSQSEKENEDNIEFLPEEQFIENGNKKVRKISNLNIKDEEYENLKKNKIKLFERRPTMGDASLSSLLFRPIENGSLRSSIYGLICVTLGTGMLPLPYFFRTNGILLTLIIFFFVLFLLILL